MDVNSLCFCQVQDLTHTLQQLQEEKETLHQLTSDQIRQVEVNPAHLTGDAEVPSQPFHPPPFLQESQQEVFRLQEELDRLHQEASDWSMQIQGLQGKLERERQERMAEVQKLTAESEVTCRTSHVTGQDWKLLLGCILLLCPSPLCVSQAHLAFLYHVYQRLLAGCVLLNQPQSMLGNFTWNELCDVINEQMDQLTSDLQNANEKVNCALLPSLNRVCVFSSIFMFLLSFGD